MTNPTPHRLVPGQPVDLGGIGDAAVADDVLISINYLFIYIWNRNQVF